MRVVVAPDKLKGSLSAAKAGAALARGARRAGAHVDEVPLADGGEGTLDIWLAPAGEVRTTFVTGPTGARVPARWGLRDGVALIESAEVLGSRLATGSVLDRTSFGVGELVLVALDAGARSIIVGLGGSSTSDAGIGCASALGVAFEGALTPPSARDLERIVCIDVRSLDPRIRACEIVVACDVLNPLTGPRGAACAFATQKGATRDEVSANERAIQHFASLAGVPVDVPGFGAAGGLGFALATFAGARVVSGADLILDHVRFDERVRGADLLITAEGKLDAQSLEGKLVATVARRTNRLGVPVCVVAGQLELSLEQLRELGVSRTRVLASGDVTRDQAMRDAEVLLEHAAEALVRELFA